MSYERVLEAIRDHNLRWNDIDQIHLNPETYEEFQQRDGRTADYATRHAPAVRETTKEEKIIYVAENGMQVTVEL